MPQSRKSLPTVIEAHPADAPRRAAGARGRNEASPPDGHAGDDALRQLHESTRRDEQVLDGLRERIPSFRCIVGCHDCCGPVIASSIEVARLPARSEADHAAALASLDCVYLGAHGCEVYDERPLICRLFGTTPRLACPNGRRPVYLVDTRTEEEIARFLAGSRQVLL